METEPTSESATRGDDGPADGIEASAVVESFDCPYCGRRFAREAWRDLHLGLDHESRLDVTEREAYEAAHDAEAEELRMFRLKALALLVLVYFGFILVYAFTL